MPDPTAPPSPAPDARAVHRYLGELHDRITSAVESIDGGQFRRDAWQRPGGGGGESRILSDGRVFERAGVSVSHVFGDKLPHSATAGRAQVAGAGFEAMGLSLVFHPRNPTCRPRIATCVFCSRLPNKDRRCGGSERFDLTPYYPCDEDVLHWHRTAREACAPFGPEVYGQYKAWCDRYFFLPHREETRGVGGLFFDDLAEGGFARCFDFLRSVGDSFLPAYLPIVERRATNPGASGNAAFSFTGAAAMSNSIYCTTAAPCSDFSPKAAPNQS